MVVLTIKEAADRCRLSVAGFRHWEKNGIVDCRIKGTNRYDLRALEACIARRSGFDDRAEGVQTIDSFEDYFKDWR